MFFPEGVDEEQCSSHTQQQSKGIKREKLCINKGGGVGGEGEGRGKKWKKNKKKKKKE